MSDERPDALLKSALEKIVYFEARAEQLHGELDTTRAEVERLRHELAEVGQREAGLRREVADLEVKVGRATAERDELAKLNQVLRAERNQLMDKLLDISRIRASSQIREDEEDDDLGIDLASFISQLRSEAMGRPAEQAHARPAASSRSVAAVGAPQAARESVAAPAQVSAQASEVVVAVAAPAPKSGSGETLSPVAQQARRFMQEGRLGVSAEQLAELTGHAGLGLADDTLFGFSVRELSASDPAARVRAAERLKALAQPAAAPALASALHAETDPVAQVALIQAFSALCKEQGASVVSPLLASPVAEVRIAALKALLTLSPRDAAPHLAQAMKDPDRSVRRRASLLALGLEGETARRLGEEAIHDADPEVRGLAALALGAASGEDARALLLEALHDPEVRVRKSAAQSLSRILGQDVSAVVSLDDAHRRREVRRLAALPTNPVRASLAPKRVPRVVASAQAPMAAAVQAVPVATSVPAAAQPLRAVGGATPAAAPAPRPLVLAKGSPASVVAAVASPPAQAPAAPRAAPAPAPARPAPAPAARLSPVEALCAPMLTDIRSAVRGRSMGELASGLTTSAELVQEALTLLVARGMVVRRGHKYFAA